jgi:Tfp pilus assembly protein PilO
MKFRSLDALKQEYNEITSRYRNVSQLLPEENQLSPLLTKIHGAALETSSRVASVEPQLPVTEGFYERESFHLTVHSTFHDFGDFLSRLSNLPFIVNVQNVDLATVEDRDNPEMATGGYTLTAKMDISTYHVKESERLILLDQPSIAQTPGE